MRKTTIAAALAVGSVVLTAGAAMAEGNGTTLGAHQRLQAQNTCYALPGYATSTPTDQVTQKWETGLDSPTDGGNTSAYKVHVPSQDTDCYYAAAAFTDKGTRLNAPVGQVKNLSFEFKNTADFGGGAPRISVQFGNGDVGYLSSEYCDNHLAVSPSWSRADFTGRTAAGCSMQVTGETGGTATYSSDGTVSAWGAYAAANPDQQLVQAYMVFDVAGDYLVDRIALPTGTGTAKLFNTSSVKAVNCATENAC
jgi:hypothetical protein